MEKARLSMAKKMSRYFASSRPSTAATTPLTTMLASSMTAMSVTWYLLYSTPAAYAPRQ